MQPFKKQQLLVDKIKKEGLKLVETKLLKSSTSIKAAVEENTIPIKHPNPISNHEVV